MPLTNIRPNSLRLSGFDYATTGFYFITICTSQRRCLLATMKSQECSLSALGSLAQECWYALPEWFQSLQLDCFVVMPSYKSSVTRRARKELLLAKNDEVWQRGYYDHIVRSERALMKMRQYIIDNPLKWHLDELNPSRF